MSWNCPGRKEFQARLYPGGDTWVLRTLFVSLLELQWHTQSPLEGKGEVNGLPLKIPKNRECFCLSPGTNSEPGISLAQAACPYLNQSLWPGGGVWFSDVPGLLTDSPQWLSGAQTPPLLPGEGWKMAVSMAEVSTEPRSSKAEA